MTASTRRVLDQLVILLGITIAYPLAVQAESTGPLPPGLASSPLTSKALLAIEDIVAPYSSFDDFERATLQNPNLLSRYHDAVSQYYWEGHLSRVRFNDFWKQILELARTVPGFKERIWETSGLGEGFVVTAHARSRGVGLDPAAWDRRRKNWIRDLESLANHSQVASMAQVHTILERVASEKRALELELSSRGLSGKDLSAKRTSYFMKLSDDPEVRGAAAFLLLERTRSPEIQSALNSQDPDAILSALEELRRQPATFPVPDGLISITQQLGLHPYFLSREAQIFPPILAHGTKGTRLIQGESSEGVYAFIPIKRRFHGIWKYPKQFDCVGGSLPLNLTPERWATIALKDSQLHVVELDGHYQGFLHSVPFVLGDHTYASLEVGSPVMSREIRIPAPAGQTHTTTVFEAALSRLEEARPKDWSGFVMSDQLNGSGNTKGRHAAFRSPHHLMGKPIGNTRELAHLEPELVLAILQYTVPGKWARSYGGNMITECFSKSRHQLTLLQNHSAAELDRALADPSWILGAMATDQSISRQYAVLTLLAGRKDTAPSTWRDIFRLMESWDNEHQILLSTALSGQADIDVALSSLFKDSPPFLIPRISHLTTTPEIQPDHPRSASMRDCLLPMLGRIFLPR